MTRSAVQSSYAGNLPALIIADDGPGAMAAAEALALAQGRSAGRVDWQGAEDRLDRQGALGLLILEAEKVPDAQLDLMLPGIGASARNAGAPIVVALSDGQIDLVAAHLLGTSATLLCAPSVDERAAAMAMAMGLRGQARLHDSSGDADDAARLRQLNQEVARIAAMLLRLSRGAAAGGEADDAAGPAGRAEGAGGLAEIDHRSITARDVRETIRVRRLRDQFFQRGMFEDPAWDMLLDLYAADLERTQVSVSSLCIAAAVAPTTALRWIAKMTEAGLFVRHADPFDKRRAYMALSPRARKGCAAISWR